MTDPRDSFERSLDSARLTLQNAITDGVDEETIAILEETVARFEALAAKRAALPNGFPLSEKDHPSRTAWRELLIPRKFAEPVDRIY